MSRTTDTPFSSRCFLGPMPESMRSLGDLKTPQQRIISAVSFANRSWRTRVRTPLQLGADSMTSIPTARPPSMMTRDTVASSLMRKLGMVVTGLMNAAHADCLSPFFVVVRFIGQPPRPSLVQVGSSLSPPGGRGERSKPISSSMRSHDGATVPVGGSSSRVSSASMDLKLACATQWDGAMGVCRGKIQPSATAQAVVYGTFFDRSDKAKGSPSSSPGKQQKR